MNDLTCLYYSANREDPAFEQRIQDTLLKTMGDIPLVSVTHKPMDFGQNICVGDVGFSAHNLFRQMQIAAEAAETRYVCCAESDILYPPEYFTFRPPEDDVFYLATPLWVLFAQRGKGHHYCRKARGSESAMMVNRQLLVDRLAQVMGNLSQWGTADAGSEKLPFLLQRRANKREFYELPAAVITFKTDVQLHRKTPHEVESRTHDLPYWGSAYTLLDRYIHGIGY